MPGVKEQKVPTEDAIGIIILTVPELFKKPNYLFDYFKGKKIDLKSCIPILNFVLSEDGSPDSRECEFLLEKTALDEGINGQPNIIPKWTFSAEFKSKDGLHLNKSETKIIFIGDFNEQNNHYSPSDRICIYDYINKQSILIDFKKMLIGVSDNISILRSINRYGERVFSFDNIEKSTVVESLVYDEDKKYVTISLKDGNQFVLPVSITYNAYNPNIRFINQHLFKANLLKNPETDTEKPQSSGKHHKIHVGRLDIAVVIKKNITRMTIGDLILTLDEIKLLYYVMELKLDTSEAKKMDLIIRNFEEKSNKMRARNRKLILKDTTGYSGIIVIYEEARKLGLMDKDFIKVLETKITELKNFVIK